MKPTVCIDFDGVIHSYTSGWKDIDVISDVPVPGAFDAIRRFLRDGWEVCIFSSRSNSAKGLLAMQEWMRGFGLEENEKTGCGTAWMLEVRFPQHKPAATISIDDRGLNFDGDWSKFDPHTLRGYRPWNKPITG